MIPSLLKMLKATWVTQIFGNLLVVAGPALPQFSPCGFACRGWLAAMEGGNAQPVIYCKKQRKCCGKK